MALRLQLRASDLALNNGDPVSSWPNAQGVTVSQGTAAWQPTYIASAYNGHPGVRFDASDDRMSTTLAIAAQPFSIVVAYVTDFTGNSARRVLQGTNNWLMGPYSQTYNLYNGGFMPGPLHRNGDPTIQVCVVDAAGTTHRNRGWWSANNGNTLAPGTIGLGAQGAFAEPANSTILEVRVYDHALTTAERDTILEELNATYGIPALIAGPAADNYCTDFSDDPIAAGIPTDWAQDVPFQPGAGTPIGVWNVRDEAGDNVLKLEGATSSAGHYRLRYVPPGRVTDCEVLTKMRIDVGVEGIVALRQNAHGLNNVYVTFSHSNLLIIRKAAVNDYTTTFANAPGDWVWVRARVDGMRVRAKAWVDGSAEPASWMLDQVVPGPDYTVNYPADGGITVGVPDSTGRLSVSHLSVGTGGLAAEDICTIPPPDQPTLSATVDCGDTTLTGSAYSGSASFLESELTIRRVSDQVVIDTVIDAVTSWSYSEGTLPYDTELEASVVYRDTAGGESLPSAWEPFTVLEPVVLSGLGISNPPDGGNVYAEVIDIGWNEPSYTGTPEADAIYEYHGEIDRFEGVGYVPLFVGLGTRSWPLDLTAYAGRQFKVRISAVLGECGFTQAETTFEVLAVPTVLFNQIGCPDVTEATEILEGEVVAFSDIECPDTMELTSEDEC